MMIREPLSRKFWFTLNREILVKNSKFTHCILAVLLFVNASYASALSCSDVDQVVKVYFRHHLSVHAFNAQLSKQTLTNFIRLWDPGKLYFLARDVDKIHHDFDDSFAKQIQKGNCAVIDKVFAKYSHRFSEVQKLLAPLIAKKYLFTKKEFLDLNRKKLPYAKDIKEIKERWRKRIKFQHLQLSQTLKDPKERIKKIQNRFKLLEKRHQEISIDKARELFLDAFASALDPQSDYMSRSEVEEFHIATRLSLEGIGAVLRTEDGITQVHSIVPGGAAFKAGTLKVGDKIVGVAQGKKEFVDVIYMALHDVVRLIRGSRGTKVRLKVKRESKTLVVDLIREKVNLPDRAAKTRVFEAEIFGMNEKFLAKPVEKLKVGVIDLPSFYMDFEGRQANRKNFKSSSKDMARELGKLTKKKVDLVVVDLRSNGGGSLDEAINVSGLFLGVGPVVQVKRGRQKPFQHSYRGKAGYNGPLIVMINQQSASASEIMAGAIQDYGRGLIVGSEHSFGKGSVQNVVDLKRGLGAAKVTISKFYRVSGASTQLRGITPDIRLPSMLDLYDIGEQYYEHPLQWDQIPPSRHKRFGMVLPYLPDLRMTSAARIKASSDFKKVYDAMRSYKESEKDRYLVSLKKEKDESEKKQEKKKEDKKDSQDEDDLDLADDILLSETLRIGVDYVRLIKGETIAAVESLTFKEQKSGKIDKRLKTGAAKRKRSR